MITIFTGRKKNEIAEYIKNNYDDGIIKPFNLKYYPEAYLHPLDVLEQTDKYIKEAENKHIYICTFSEALFLRILRRIREYTNRNEQYMKDNIIHFKLKPEHIEIHHIFSEKCIIKSTIIRTNEKGEFIDRWPDGFFIWRLEELI